MTFNEWWAEFVKGGGYGCDEEVARVIWAAGWSNGFAFALDKAAVEANNYGETFVADNILQIEPPSVE
jgi:hypothetical protein